MPTPDDAMLIEVNRHTRTPVFLLSVLATAVVWFTAWGSVMDGFIQYKSPFGFTTTESNVFDLAKGARTPDADIAIVGSSLARKLQPELFEHSRVMNLAVGGGSVMTGLEVLRSVTALPKVVLVEINILDRPADEDWWNKGTWAAQPSPAAVLAGVTRPMRYLLTRPFFVHASATEHADFWKRQRTDLRRSDPAPAEIHSAVSAGLSDWNRRNNWDIANRNILRIREVAAEFESRGTHVHFLYLPYSEPYDRHAFAQRNRAIAGGSDSFDCARCIDVRRLVPVSDLRWPDDVHLDEKSALLVAEALERRLQPELR